MFNKSIACIILMCGALFSCSYCPPDGPGEKSEYVSHVGTLEAQKRLEIVKESKTFKELVNKVHEAVRPYAIDKRESASSHVSLEACAEYCAQVIESTALKPETFAKYVETHGELTETRGKLTLYNEHLVEALIKSGPLNDSCCKRYPDQLYRCVCRLSETSELIV